MECEKGRCKMREEGRRRESGRVSLLILGDERGDRGRFESGIEGGDEDEGGRSSEGEWMEKLPFWLVGL